MTSTRGQTSTSAIVRLLQPSCARPLPLVRSLPFSVWFLAAQKGGTIWQHSAFGLVYAECGCCCCCCFLCCCFNVQIDFRFVVDVVDECTRSHTALKVEEVRGAKHCLKLVKYDLAFYLAFFCMIWNLLTCSSCANYSPSPSFSFSLTLLVYKQSALCPCSANSLPYGFSFPLQHHTHACLLPTLQIIIPPKKAYEFMKTSKKIYVWYMKTPEIM